MNIKKTIFKKRNIKGWMIKRNRYKRNYEYKNVEYYV